jgi:hypothetical protein
MHCESCLNPSDARADLAFPKRQRKPRHRHIRMMVAMAASMHLRFPVSTKHGSSTNVCSKASCCETNTEQVDNQRCNATPYQGAESCTLCLDFEDVIIIGQLDDEEPPLFHGQWNDENAFAKSRTNHSVIRSLLRDFLTSESWWRVSYTTSRTLGKTMRSCLRLAGDTPLRLESTITPPFYLPARNRIKDADLRDAWLGSEVPGNVFIRRELFNNALWVQQLDFQLAAPFQRKGQFPTPRGKPDPARHQPPLQGKSRGTADHLQVRLLRRAQTRWEPDRQGPQDTVSTLQA